MESRISISDFVCAISDVIDLVTPALDKHHKKVAYLSCRIAQEMDLPNNEIQDIIIASIMHDIGSFSIEDRMKSLMFEYGQNDIQSCQHAFIGYKLLKGFEPLARAAYLIRHHHTVYDKSRYNIPIGSYIINLADRASVLFDEQREILEQVPEVYSKILEKQHLFHPHTVKAFNRLKNFEYVWIETFSPSFSTNILREMLFTKEIIDLEMLRCFAKVIAQIIDFRNRFTATHSSSVAAVALKLAIVAGLSERECKLMEITGFLHDLGKLGVSNSILEKTSPLNDEEFNTVKKHSYYTYIILEKISGMEQIAAWAAHHHERQDGTGYPFRVKGKDFSRLARILAVADVMTALAENRPYRDGMDRKRITETLFFMAENGEIDKSIVELVNANYSYINNARIKAQWQAYSEYEDFYNTSVENQSCYPIMNSFAGDLLTIPAAKAV
jgi:HD-GYP domain-containing protein (c-di-GMP phosphodiesterase class II)